MPLELAIDYVRCHIPFYWKCTIKNPTFRDLIEEMKAPHHKGWHQMMDSDTLPAEQWPSEYDIFLRPSDGGPAPRIDDWTLDMPLSSKGIGGWKLNQAEQELRAALEARGVMDADEIDDLIAAVRANPAKYATQTKTNPTNPATPSKMGERAAYARALLEDKPDACAAMVLDSSMIQRPDCVTTLAFPSERPNPFPQNL